MFYYVKYFVLGQAQYAGPYDETSVHSHRGDIEGYSGVSCVSIEEAAPFYKLKDPLGFCGNYWPAKMFKDGRWWQTVEHLYQAQKTFDPKEFNAIHEAKTPKQARDLGQLVTMRPDWNDVKYRSMKECLILKFTQHHDLLEQLLETGTKILVEDSDRDAFWGWGADKKGLNMLGKALMEVRQELSYYNDKTYI